MIEQSTSPLILVDGSSYLFRAYYALPPLISSLGQPTGAIYGVINMLRKLISEYQPQYLAVIFDSKEPTFRHKMYNHYKANRAKMPDDLQQQIAPLHTIIRALGIPLIVEDGVEADDVIATLAEAAQQQGFSVLISTGDKDLTQLVNERITLINTMTNQTMDEAGVKDKFGVTPTQMIDYLSLVGDSADNIPGVPKVGPKTAAKWLNQYGSLASLIEQSDQIKGKVGENLRHHIDEFPLAQALVTIKKDVPLAVGPQQLNLQAQNQPALLKLFAQFEFKQWLKELSSTEQGGEQPASVEDNTDYTLVLESEQWLDWQNKLKSSELFAFDTETTSLNAIDAELVGFSLAVPSGESAYIPLQHDYAGAPQQLDKKSVLRDLAVFLQDNNKTIIGQNLKYDIKVLLRENVQITAKKWDTLLESYVLNSVSTRHDLDSLALKYLDQETIKFEDIAGKGAKQLTFNQIALTEAGPYAAEDAAVTLALHQCLFPQIQQQANCARVLKDIEMPLMPILAAMEYHGVLIDATLLQQQSQALQQQLCELEKNIYSIAGHEFNIGSPKQLQHVLFVELQLPVLKKTPGGQASTAEAVLQDLAHDYPLPELILSYRSLSKLKSTYTDKLPQQINARTGRVHTSYNQAVTATGRLSSNSPNLQNIPVRTAAGRQIRQAFIAPPGHQIVAADYSQIELRIIAHISQDPGLLSAFQQGLDVHRATAAEVFNVSVSNVTDEQRRSAKAINFGLLYGMSAFGLAKQLSISKKEAEQHMSVYFKRYPKVHDYMESIRQTAATQGYVETLFGRRLYMPEINSKNVMRRKAAERAAINAPMQGTAADIIKLAMIAVDEWCATEKEAVVMIMQVHDELVFEVATNAVERVLPKIRRCMEGAAELAVPLIVDIGTGNNWDEAH